LDDTPLLLHVVVELLLLLLLWSRRELGLAYGNCCTDDEDWCFAKTKPLAIALSLSLSQSKSLHSKKTDPNAKVSPKRPSEGDPNAKFSLKHRSEGDPNTISLRLPLVQEQFQIDIILRIRRLPEALKRYKP
jgi:hypothetical protein